MIGDDAATTLWMYMVAAAVLALPGIPVMLGLRYFIRRTVSPVPASIARAWYAKIGFGLAIGCGLIALSVVPGWLAGAYNPSTPDWQSFGPSADQIPGLSAGGALLIFTFQSAFEELLYRAVCMGLFALMLLWILRLLGLGCADGTRSLLPAAWLWTGIAASAVITVAFAGSHAGNPNVSPVGLANIALAGLLLGLLAWRDGDIWGAWALHFAWNAALAQLGLPVSGLHEFSSGPIAGAVSGLLTGGRFGPEASLPNTAALLLAVCLVAWLAARQPVVRQSTAANGAPAPESEAQ